MRAARSSSSLASVAVMMGVETVLAALMISLMRGTPSVTFIEATPAKWKVLSVICVPAGRSSVAAAGEALEAVRTWLSNRLSTDGANSSSCESHHS